MSSIDIASARNRYLDMYPLTREDLDSAAYVDSLLRIDEAQVRLRQQARPRGTCPGCVELERTVAELRAALSSCGVPDDPPAVRTAAVSAIFRRYFILDGIATTSRTEVRTVIESVLQHEVDPGITLPSQSEVWSGFIRRTLGLNGSSSGPIRCRRRASPLAAEEVGLPAADQDHQ